jgi:hypothetical protein
VGLPHLSTYLATIGGAGSGCTAVVYAQSLAALEAVYGAAEAESIASNASFQVFAAPRNLKTAQYLSELMGDELEVVRTSSSGVNSGTSQSANLLVAKSHSAGDTASWSLSTRYKRHLSPTEATAIPRGEVAVFALGRRARLASSMTVWAPWLDRLPPAPAGSTAPGPQRPAGDDGDAPAAATVPPDAPAPDPSLGSAPKPKPGETAPPAAGNVLW